MTGKSLSSGGKYVSVHLRFEEVLSILNTNLLSFSHFPNYIFSFKC